jgi:HK97 family phage prohead protease
MNIRISNDSVEIDGYVNAVERLSRPLHDRLGDFMERIKAGAFKKALERADDVRILLNHAEGHDIGGIKDGNLQLNEDAIGLKARAVIKDADVIKKARAGELVGWSFGFTDREGGVDLTNESGLTVRNVKDLNLFEVSLISREKIPAYEGTLVSVRTNDGAMFISDITESENEIIRAEDAQDGTQDATGDEAEEIAEETQNAEIRAENAPKDENVVDYSKYKEIIKEMKGEK